MCLDCGHRERLLPFFVLPGKTTRLETIVEAAAAWLGGERIAAIARRLEVARGSIRNWVRGLAARALDLVALLRHRASPARPDSALSGRLVAFSA